MERTLVLIKPEAVNNHHVGEILSIYEKNGLKIESIYSCVPTLELLNKHYVEHIGKPFFEPLVAYMMSGMIVVVAISGDHAVEKVREINGSTNPAQARPCTIRYLYGESVQQNTVHGSANLEDAKRELEIWFNE